MASDHIVIFLGIKLGVQVTSKGGGMVRNIISCKSWQVWLGQGVRRIFRAPRARGSFASLGVNLGVPSLPAEVETSFPAVLPNEHTHGILHFVGSTNIAIYLIVGRWCRLCVTQPTPSTLYIYPAESTFVHFIHDYRFGRKTSSSCCTSSLGGILATTVLRLC